MFRPPAAEQIQFAGPTGLLEGIVEAPDAGPAIDARQAAACAVILHPHPLAGGTMTNKVVHTLARIFQELDVPTLRFNFRGVGASAGSFDAGRGETDDALAAVAWVRQRWPNRLLWLGGFSFGSFVALQAAARCNPALLVTVAPPVGRWDFGEIATPHCPWLIVQGDSDELVDASAVQQWGESLNPRPQVTTLPGVDHFFHGHLHELKKSVLAFARARLT